ncbi:UTP--glucose-1-phosphate uridylyltransferase GalU [Geobacter sulfurreducens]|jgi:UTP--glucose-1-phosphate uridylyltransferase|uniref:UTP--glucose-1-phosphate uridylyltransferase GalU n=1 Tax=Geobacter sulfurreducens TaxID=35554 RepID=UPI001BDC4E10|nr:UTP--glucose-1-phosphate uridylyltransferase GalU [Geobacter sulfurreducens]QVW36104.1 UTP--glucose-1-phosphate uridylyltransferase GalU [Geobacter sulfurreducens]UTG93544.1 UTP--glucose-1-phosphate uridylyltransferase GalU [Geobacter sulfurreducens]
MQVKKAVFPVAGLGTRFLPATKSSPKEMLPLIDKPLVQYVVEEAVASGIEQLLFVTGRSKRAIEDHFDISFELEALLQEKGKDDMLQEVREIADMVKIFYVRQKQALGLGHAILCAREFVGDEPFAVLLGDDIIDAEQPCLGQLLDVYRKYRGPVVALEKVPIEAISSYGCVKATGITDRIFEVTDLVEKPRREEAPSDMAIIGRYVLTPDIFPILERQTPGKGGEIQLTDALLTLSREEAIYGCLFKGKRHDCGDKLGFLKATVDMALKREEFNEEFLDYLREVLARG